MLVNNDWWSTSKERPFSDKRQNHYLKNKIVQSKMEKKAIRNQEKGQPENPLGQAKDLTALRHKKQTNSRTIKLKWTKLNPVTNESTPSLYKRFFYFFNTTLNHDGKISKKDISLAPLPKWHSLNNSSNSPFKSSK